MRPFISLTVLFRRTIVVLGLLLTLSYTLLAIRRTEDLGEPSTGSYRVLDKVRRFNFGQGYIPVAFRPSTYLGTTAVKEPTTREEWESLTREEWDSFAGMIEDEEYIPTEYPKWAALKKQVGNIIHRYTFASLVFGPRQPPRYRTNWEDLPPHINAFKQWEYNRGMLYQGTGARMQRFLEKARSGRGIVVSVVGGSVSKGRGLPQRNWNPSGPAVKANATMRGQDRRNLAHDWHIDPRPSVSQNLYNPLNLHHQIFQFLNRTFPVLEEQPETGKPSRGANVFVNGAQGGVGSDYFAGCWKEHVPEDSDLVLVDLGINDIRDLSSMENYELLLRSILEMESQPAVLNLQPFSLLFSTLSSASSLHIDVSAYYDTPVISIRDVVLPRILNDPTRQVSAGGGVGTGLEIAKWFRNVPEEELVIGDAKNVYVPEADRWVDLMHISAHGHTLLAELAVHYLQTQIQLMSPYDTYNTDEDLLHDVRWVSNLTQEGTDAESSIAYEDKENVARTSDVPGILLTSHYTNKPALRSNPSCISTNAALKRDRLRLNRDGIRSHGAWFEYDWGEKHYLVAKEPGSRISIPFNVTVPGLRPNTPNRRATAGAGNQMMVGQGYVKLGHLRSSVLGLGSLDCWVDRDTDSEEKSRQEDNRGRGTWKHPTRVDGWWDIRERNQGVLTTIAEDLLPGPHTLQCKLLDQTLDPGGGTEFRLIAVVYD